MIGLLGWFFPNLRNFKEMGILNLSLKPMLWVLTQERGIQGRMALIRAGQMPHGASEGHLWALWHSLFGELAEAARIRAAWIGTQYPIDVHEFVHEAMFIEEYFSSYIDEACFKAQMAWAVFDSVHISLSDPEQSTCTVSLLDGNEITYVKDNCLDEASLFEIIESTWTQIKAVPDFKTNGNKALKGFAAIERDWSARNALLLFATFARGCKKFESLHRALAHVVPDLRSPVRVDQDVPVSPSPLEIQPFDVGFSPNPWMDEYFGMLAGSFYEAKPFNITEYFREALPQRTKSPKRSKHSKSSPSRKGG